MARLAALLLVVAVGACGFGDDAADSELSPSSDSGTGDAGDEATGATVDCAAPNICDPLSPDCEDGQVCAPSDQTFTCTPIAGDGLGVAPGEPCGGAASCQPGLVCLSVAVPGCTGGQGCCVPVCELSAPQCGDAGTCSPFFAMPPPCFDDVGVCLNDG